MEIIGPERKAVSIFGDLARHYAVTNLRYMDLVLLSNCTPAQHNFDSCVDAPHQGNGGAPCEITQERERERGRERVRE